MCFDLSQVKFFGNLNSPSFSMLDIHVQIREDFCTNKNDSTTRDQYQTEDIIEALQSGYDLPIALECETSQIFERLMERTLIITITNQQRFDTESYASGGPIVKESTLTWSEIPTRPVKRNIRIEESILERDDNQFMSINGVTDDEDTFFTLKKWSDETRT